MGGGRWQLSSKAAELKTFPGPPAPVQPSAFPLRPDEAWVSVAFSTAFPDLMGQQEVAALNSVHVACPPVPEFYQPQSPSKSGPFGSQAVALGQRRQGSHHTQRHFLCVGVSCCWAVSNIRRAHLNELVKMQISGHHFSQSGEDAVSKFNKRPGGV